MLIAVFALLGVMEQSGLFEDVGRGLSKLAKGPASTEATIVGCVGILSMITGVISVAIVAMGDLVKELGEKAGLDPYRRANLMDGFGSTLPAVIPVTSAFIFIALSCIQGLMDTYSFVQEVSPVSLAGASLHCWFLFVALAVAVITGWGRKYEGPNGEPVKALPAQTK